MIRLDALTVHAGSFCLNEVSLEIPGGSYAVLMGRTGSGKTTLLEAICGLKRISSGTIWLGKIDITNWRPADRGIGFVPQDLALFTHLTVRQHLAFGPKVHRWSRDNIRNTVGELAEALDLTPLLDRAIQGLSGGERQRVALGRALAIRPHVLCLDEPLNAVDQETHDSLCAMLQRVTQETTVLHITHNPAEADRLAKHQFLLEDGKVRRL